MRILPFILIAFAQTADTTHLRYFREASDALNRVILPIAGRTDCEIDQIGIDADSAQFHLTARITVRRSRRLYLDFWYLRDPTGWQRYPLTHPPRRSYAPCYDDRAWVHLDHSTSIP